MISKELPDSSIPYALTSTEQARLAATLDNWKRKLLDVSKRNRALHFKPNKITTITIADEQPAEVFRYLYLQEKAMRFLPAAQQTVIEVNDTNNILQEETLSHESQAFEPYAASTLSPKHTDDRLQTTTTSEKLDQSLRRMDEQARTSIEEQGVNTLFLALGMLHYKESASSTDLYQAPLLLLPVQLSRKNARTGYTLQITDDDPMANPALAEYLWRNLGVHLPELPDLTTLSEDYDLQQFFIAVTEAIAGKEGWQVKTDIYLSFFSFQKFTMYKDLEDNLKSFASHPIIQQLILRSGSAVRSLPEEIRYAKLDQVIAPESSAQVTNADASQLRAILAVSQKHNLVIEGPPGTGKSQTITNLIAQALSENKKILFVAEKIAALEVVYNRLVDAGLGEFCLELHATKVHKRAVMQQIATALDASLQDSAASRTASQRIGTVRQELTSYVTTLHAPFGTLGFSPYQGFGMFEKVRQSPKVAFSLEVDTISADTFYDTERDLQDLAHAALPIGLPAVHSWRDTTRTFYTEQDLDTLTAQLGSIQKRLVTIQTLNKQAQETHGLFQIRHLTDGKAVAQVARVLGTSPGVQLSVLQNEAWITPPRQAVDMVARGQRFVQLQQEVATHLHPTVFEMPHSDDADFIETNQMGIGRFFNWMNGRFKAIERRWLGYRLSSYQGSLLEQTAYMRKADRIQTEQQALRQMDIQGKNFFGQWWQGEHSDWNALQTYIQWVVSFQSLLQSYPLTEKAVSIVTQAKPDVSVLVALADELEQLSQEVQTWVSLTGLPETYFTKQLLTDIEKRAHEWEPHVHLGPRWAAFESSRVKVAQGLAAELLPSAMNGDLEFAVLAPAFRRAFLQKWLQFVFQACPSLLHFSSLTHEQRLAEFRKLDETVLTENRANLVNNLRNRLQLQLRTPEVTEAMPFLRRQLTLQRGLSPLRVTLQKSFAAIREIKPVFMMSPLSVAQLLDGDFPPFDLVIFDEASQLPTEDAIGAIARGEQLVVVGDPKQLPPTNFFSVMSGTVTAPIGDDGIPLFEDSESILEEFLGSGAPMTRLKWHYRSAHESLINFSNSSFYESDLFTFPSIVHSTHTHGLSFVYIPDGVYEGKGLNMKEASRVADAVIQHAQTHPELSLGVGTFNMRQQLAIQDELELRRRKDPSLEAFFVRTQKEPFFVKNLENIQGDERDVIFLSVTYGKDASGTMRYNFGPLNGENGWRRLNVLTTRARRSMRVFSSIKAEDIKPTQTTAQGPQLLRNFLQYAEQGILDGLLTHASTETESPFEQEVYLALTRKGLKLQPQVGEAGYRIDLGVLDETLPGRFLCGIECDGAAYHSSETARDRDRLRQQVLEARGWVIHRLWSTDWFKDRQGQIERLLMLIEKTRLQTPYTLLADEQTGAEEKPSKTSSTSKEVADASNNEPEVVAEALSYVFANTRVLYPGQDFNEATVASIKKAIEEVVEVEAPLHVKDLATRVVARWGYSVVGTHMMRRIDSCVNESVDQIIRKGDFLYLKDQSEPVAVRSREDTSIPAERIAPDEYTAAVLLVLQAGDGLDRKTLTNKVRALFGFSRTGSTLEAAIGMAIEGLLEKQIVGEASTGIKLRG